MYLCELLSQRISPIIAPQMTTWCKESLLTEGECQNNWSLEIIWECCLCSDVSRSNVMKACLDTSNLS